MKTFQCLEKLSGLQNLEFSSQLYQILGYQEYFSHTKKKKNLFLSNWKHIQIPIFVLLKYSKKHPSFDNYFSCKEWRSEDSARLVDQS